MTLLAVFLHITITHEYRSMLHSISPVDGRYADKTADLVKYFSEAALMRYRVKVEVEYLIALLETGIIPKTLSKDIDKEKIRTILTEFKDDDVQEMKGIESKINHDVKAVEYFIKSKLDEFGASSIREWVHFGLTSQDINNSAFPMMIRSAYKEKVIPAMQSLSQAIYAFAKSTMHIPMMAYTHGQPASPTLLGKEMMVFVERIDVQIEQLEKTELKIGRASC